LAGSSRRSTSREQAVKGRAAVHAHEVLRPRGRRSRLDAAIERGLTPLVGRERELDILRDRFREAHSGHGQVVFVAGEAGIGKSRLLLEFRRGLADAGEDATWLEGQCVSFGQSIPFLPIVDQLRRNFGIEELDGEPEIIAKIEHGMRRMGGLETHIPYVRYLLGVDPGDPKVAAIDAAARRARILEAVRALSLRGAQIRPIVFVFEDLHWVDTSTEEYLTGLMDAVGSAPILLVLTYRIGYVPPFGSRSFYTTLTLRALSEDDTLAMAGGVLGTRDFPHELRAALTAKAEGVPLYVEEVTKTLLDVGVLRRENGGYRLVRQLDEARIPDTIQGIIMARLDRLGEDGKRTVQLASVIGRQFLKRLLGRIAGLTHELDGLLGELKTLEIIYELGLLPEPAYIFKHAVIQDVAYQSLLVQRRRDLHRAVGQAIEELYSDRLADHYEELAHHLAQGEVWAQAFLYLSSSVRRQGPGHLCERGCDRSLYPRDRGRSEGERKQVTVLFADVSGFTSLSERLDPEDVHALMNQAFELMLGEVHRYEGTVNQFLGDGIMALFGAPIAHEDHAQRAAYAALAIRRRLDELRDELERRRGIVFQVRQGLNTGLVVVGSIGTDLRMDYTAVGDTTNVAARLQQIADPGHVVISSATHRLVDGYFYTRALGVLSLKGKAEAVPAWELISAREARTRLDIGAERGLTPFVGRQRELGLLRDAFERVGTGQGQIVFIAGELGIGKSRQLPEFHRQLGGEATWVEGHCMSFGRSIAFHPLIDLLKRSFRIYESDAEPAIVRKIERAVLGLGEDLRPILPHLRYLLSIDPGHRALATMDPQQRRGSSSTPCAGSRCGPPRCILRYASSRTSTGWTERPRITCCRSPTASPRAECYSCSPIAPATSIRLGSGATTPGWRSMRSRTRTVSKWPRACWPQPRCPTTSAA
jgi:class 3 adenylate cyclase